MEQIRILHLINELGLGGAETVVINIINHFNSDKFKNKLCVFVPDGVLTHLIKNPNENLIELDKKPGNDIRLPFKLNNIFKEYKPHIIHTHCWGTLVEGYIAAKIAKIPALVHSEHGTIEDKNWNLYIQRYLWHLHNQIIAVSQEHKNRLTKTIGFPENKINVIYNGVDTEHFKQISNSRRIEKRKSLGVCNKNFVIGTVGRLEPVKDQVTLLYAFKIILQQFPNSKLVITGDGSLASVLKNTAASLRISNSVLFLGLRDDILELLGTMDIFVLPSISEGTSCTLLEAMSCGLPVVATNVGGNPELVLDNETGVLVPKQDSKKLSHAIITLLTNSDLRTKMSLSGRERIVQGFSLYKMIDNLKNLYNSLHVS
ncbi:MAG: glycosyltransferase [Deltaproteobacteria bacterium]|nr:glycosyltransferase [Deltaproteobacteria bacterium]